MSRIDYLTALTFAAAAAAISSPPPSPQTSSPSTRPCSRRRRPQGRPILVDVARWLVPHLPPAGPDPRAGWRSDPAFDKLLILRLNYDKQNDEKRALGVRMQSTLIAFKGKTETGRSVGVTNRDAITALAQTALN